MLLKCGKLFSYPEMETLIMWFRFANFQNLNGHNLYVCIGVNTK